MARTAKTGKEKRQSIITLRHEGQSMRKMSRTFQVYSSAVAKTIKRYDETGSHEASTGKADAQLPLLQGISSLELTAPQKSAINYTSDCSPNKCFTEFK